jgi:hypothetical protein
MNPLPNRSPGCVSVAIMGCYYTNADSQDGSAK